MRLAFGVVLSENSIPPPQPRFQIGDLKGFYVVSKKNRVYADIDDVLIYLISNVICQILVEGNLFGN